MVFLYHTAEADDDDEEHINIRFWLSVTVRAVVDVVGRDAVLCVKRIAILSNS